MLKIAMNRNFYYIFGIMLLLGTWFGYSEESSPILYPSLWSSSNRDCVIIGKEDINVILNEVKNLDLLGPEILRYAQDDRQKPIVTQSHTNKGNGPAGLKIHQDSNLSYPAIATLVNSSASGSVLLSFIRVSQDEEEFFFQRKTADGKWKTIQPAPISLIKIGDLTLGKSEDQGLVNGTYAYRVLAKKQSGQIIASEEGIVGLEYSSAVLRPRAIDLNQDGVVDEEDLLDLMQNDHSETGSSKPEDLWNLGSGWYTGQSVIRH